jgi:hypothetical protein
MKYTVNFINLTDEDLSYTDLINVSNSHGGLHLRNISGRLIIELFMGREVNEWNLPEVFYASSVIITLIYSHKEIILDICRVR